MWADSPTEDGPGKFPCSVLPTGWYHLQKVNTHWTLAQTLKRHGKKVPALVKATGLPRNTVYDIVKGRTKTVKLDTVDRLLAGLEAITGQPMTIGDVLHRPAPDMGGMGLEPALQAQLAGARPFNAEELLALIPDWTAEERAENDRFWAESDAEKRAVRDTPRQGKPRVSGST